MRYYLIAGERSGDLHASNLAKALKRNDPNALMHGFGGDYMQEAGVKLTVHYRELAFMGFLEVLMNLNKISGFIKICKQDITQFKPDVVILVDYGGFNTRIAKFCHKEGIKVFFYISPKVWAWNQKRAWTLKANIDRMFVILPFEKTFFKKFDWEVDYVGNPVLDAIKNHVTDSSFIVKHKLKSDQPLIALLPGSRKQELQNVTPVMAAVARRFPQYEFGVAAVSNIDQSMYNAFDGLQNVTLIQEDTYNLLSYARAAIVTSGTATLETALLKVPQVCIYKTSYVSYKIAKNFIRVPYISLVNLIADKLVIKECIQSDMTEEKIATEIQALVAEGKYRTEMLSEYERIYKLLDIGSASENAARLMVDYLK